MQITRLKRHLRQRNDLTMQKLKAQESFTLPEKISTADQLPQAHLGLGQTWGSSLTPTNSLNWKRHKQELWESLVIATPGTRSCCAWNSRSENMKEFLYHGDVLRPNPISSCAWRCNFDAWWCSSTIHLCTCKQAIWPWVQDSSASFFLQDGDTERSEGWGDAPNIDRQALWPWASSFCTTQMHHP